MSFTYVIPFRYVPDRLAAFRKVLSHIQSLDAEVIIVEQDVESWLPRLDVLSHERHIFVKTPIPYPFNRSWALNVGWKAARHPAIVFADADLLIPHEVLLRSVQLLAQYDFVSPYQRVIDLTETESELSVAHIFQIQRHGRGEKNWETINKCGGMTVFRNSALERVAGWPEEFFGWGCEDNVMEMKVNHLLTYHEMPGNCYHLFHPRGAPNMAWYKRSFAIYQRYAQLTLAGLEKHLDEQRPLVGDPQRQLFEVTF